MPSEFNEQANKLLTETTKNHIIQNYTNENEKTENIYKFINQLSHNELCAFNIAVEQLKTSFDIEKSIIYLNWISK